MVAKPKPKKGNDTSSPTENLPCEKCGIGCGKSGHKVRDCPNVRGQVKGSCQSQESGSNKGPKKNRFSALCSRGEQETSPNMVTSMLKVFFIDVYALPDRAG